MPAPHRARAPTRRVRPCEGRTAGPAAVVNGRERFRAGFYSLQARTLLMGVQPYSPLLVGGEGAVWL